MKNFIFGVFFLCAVLGGSMLRAETETPIPAGTRMVKQIRGVEYAFRWCPPGNFLMGSAEAESGTVERFGERARRFHLPHRVTLTRGFWILETEVTQEMWESLMETDLAGQCRKMYQSEGWIWMGEENLWMEARGSRFPMYHVTWDESRRFCEALSRELSDSGMKAALPTEAQWEYACRAGTEGEFSDSLELLGWFERNSERKPSFAGLKKPNAWGILDMHGNVTEWCADWHGKYPNVSVSDPQGPQTGIARVHRGGAWGYSSNSCRTTYRGCSSPGYRDFSIGFRVALNPAVSERSR